MVHGAFPFKFSNKKITEKSEQSFTTKKPIITTVATPVMNSDQKGVCNYNNYHLEHKSDLADIKIILYAFLVALGLLCIVYIVYRLSRAQERNNQIRLAQRNESLNQILTHSHQSASK